MSLPQEKVYYQSDEALVTSTRAEIGGKTFVMTNITSVSMVEVPSQPGCAVGLLLAGGLLAYIGWLQIGGSSYGIDEFAPLVLGIIFVIVAVVWLTSLKTAYAVNLTSASGETRAMQSTDKNRVTEIVDAFKQAIIDSDVKRVQSVTVTTEQARKADETVAQRLKTLKELFDSKMITEQEYEAKRNELLSKL